MLRKYFHGSMEKLIPASNHNLSRRDHGEREREKEKGKIFWHEVCVDNVHIHTRKMSCYSLLNGIARGTCTTHVSNVSYFRRIFHEMKQLLGTQIHFTF